MTVGRTPQPANLKLVKGRSTGRDSGGRKVEQGPAFRRLPPEPPEWLPAEARAEWDRVVPELQRLELLKEIDRAALTSYCMTWQRFVDASKIVIDEGGVIHDDKLGRSQRHPAILTAEAASKELRAWTAEFGLTPSSESRLTSMKGASGDEAKNPFAAAG